MKSEELLEQLGIARTDYEDLHIVRLFSAFAAVSEGQIVSATEPILEYCPLLSYLSPETKGRGICREFVEQVLEEKISIFGHFTDRRQLYREDIVVPYGASEMLMYAIRKKTIDAAVVVCDGAGTVLVDRPGVVQGIGARMNSLFYTSPLSGLIDRLRCLGCHIPFPETAKIDQARGLKEAARLGYEKIAVTINPYTDDLGRVKEVAERDGVLAVCLVVCTTGIDQAGLRQVAQYGDLVWSCASEGIRNLGRKAILQLSKAIPVFALSRQGLELVSSYCDDDNLEGLNSKTQYLVSGEPKGKRVKMGNFTAYLTEQALPVRSKNEPRPLT